MQPYFWVSFFGLLVYIHFNSCKYTLFQRKKPIKIVFFFLSSFIYFLFMLYAHARIDKCLPAFSVFFLAFFIWLTWNASSAYTCVSLVTKKNKKKRFFNDFFFFSFLRYYSLPTYYVKSVFNSLQWPFLWKKSEKKKERTLNFSFFFLF